MMRRTSEVLQAHARGMPVWPYFHGCAFNGLITRLLPPRVLPHR